MKLNLRNIKDITIKNIPMKGYEGWYSTIARSGNYVEPDGTIRKLTRKEISKINREDLLATLFDPDHLR